MNVLYVTDLHGDKQKYEASLKLAVNKEIKLIVNGGDMLPKLCDRHKEQPRFIDVYLRDYFIRLKEQGITYLCILGNDDLKAIDPLFNEFCDAFDHVHQINDKKIAIGDYEFIGMDSILDHPFGCKDRVVMEDNYIFQDQLSRAIGVSNEIGYDRIYDWHHYAKTELPRMEHILSTLPKSNDSKKAIYVMHMPPAYLKLGQLWHQDLDIGSIAIHEFIKEEQPLLTLHGHIHEAPDTETGKWINQINQTTCIQSGQTELNESHFIYVELDLKNQIYTREKEYLLGEA